MTVDMSTSGISRRTLLGVAGASALSLAALPAWAREAGRSGKKQAKNIIFLVSDGMSCGVPTMLDHFLQLTTGKGSYWSWLYRQEFVVNGLQDTRSLTGVVTDSSAASSSWGSGRRIWNGMVNAYPDVPLTPLYRLLIDRAKMRTGLVTTTTITHATPAGFAISHPSRDEERQIAEKYLESGVDVLMGGGDRFFAASNSTSRPQGDLYREFQGKGYRIARNRQEMLALDTGKPVLGVFASGHLPFEIDRLNNDDIRESVPTLAEMTTKALQLLGGASEGFILQIEGGRVDHAAHANDFGAIIHDQHAFEQALQVAVEYALKDGETLLVATSDHGNSNPGLMGSGDEYAASNAGLLTLAGMKSSYERLSKDLASAKGNAEGLRSLVAERLGVQLTSDEASFVVRGIEKKSGLEMVDLYGSMTSILAIALSNHTHVGWSGRSHSSDLTRVTAMGPGSEAFAGLSENHTYFGKLLAHRDIVFENPTMSFDEVKKRISEQQAKALAEAVARHAVPDPHWA